MTADRVVGGVDVVSVLGGLAELAGYRLKTKRDPVFRKLAKGEMPHMDEVTKVDRAEYLRDQAWAAQQSVAELLAAAKEVENDARILGMETTRLTAALANARGAK